MLLTPPVSGLFELAPQKAPAKLIGVGKENDEENKD
jgi:hypothetical protein